jgi:tetrahydromethanopterin S-methyltransferase subunit G
MENEIQKAEAVVSEVVNEAKTVAADVVAEAKAVVAKVDETLTADEKLAIRESQIELMKIENEYRALQARAQQLTAALEARVTAIAQRLGKDITKVVLDIETLTFKARAEITAGMHKALNEAQKVVNAV